MFTSVIQCNDVYKIYEIITIVNISFRPDRCNFPGIFL